MCVLSSKTKKPLMQTQNFAVPPLTYVWLLVSNTVSLVSIRTKKTPKPVYV